MHLHDLSVSCLWALFIPYIVVADDSKAEVERHLAMGKQLLSKGQFADALNHYHAAIDIDADNHMTLYWRATVYLAMGKSKAALPDLDRVVELKPDFTSARLQRGNMLLKQGELDKAREDFQVVVDVEPQNAQAGQKLAELPGLIEIIDHADDLYDNNDFAQAEQFYSQAIESCQWNAGLREKRATCYVNTGRVGQAVADYRAVAKLQQNPTDTYFRISMLYYNMGDAQESLNQVRECLKVDPDHKECYAHYKVVKKLVKQQDQMVIASTNEQWEECLERWQAALKTEKENLAIRAMLDMTACRCHAKAGHSQEAIATCSSVLDSGVDLESDRIQTICNRAEAHIDNDDFDSAIKDYQSALEIEEGNRRAKEGMHRAQKLQKQASRRDYYKILGVRRNANKREITKAYRELAMKWHPDNFMEEDEKKKAEAKFIDIASAKEVLTDKEKRARFDSGEDPLDPEQNQGGGHHHHGFNPFGGGGGGGGGPFSFKFNFG